MASEIMTVDHPTLRETDTYSQIMELFRTTGSHGFAVVDEDEKFIGVLTKQDFNNAPNHPLFTRTRSIPTVDESPVLEVEDLTARHLATVSPAWVMPDDTVHSVVYRMASQHIGRIPVVERSSKKLVGLVRRSDIVKAYQIGLNRRLDVQQRDRESELKDLDGVRICECVVHPKSAVTSVEIRDIEWPPRAIVISIRRAGQIILPHGDTVIQADDMMTVLSDLGSQRQLKKLIEEEARP